MKEKTLVSVSQHMTQSQREKNFCKSIQYYARFTLKPFINYYTRINTNSQSRNNYPYWVILDDYLIYKPQRKSSIKT